MFFGHRRANLKDIEKGLIKPVKQSAIVFLTFSGGVVNKITVFSNIQIAHRRKYFLLPMQRLIKRSQNQNKEFFQENNITHKCKLNVLLLLTTMKPTYKSKFRLKLPIKSANFLLQINFNIRRVD